MLVAKHLLTPSSVALVTIRANERAVRESRVDLQKRRDPRFKAQNGRFRRMKDRVKSL